MKFFISLVILVVLLQVYKCSGFSASFQLERSFPLSQNASEVAARDKARNGRILSSANSNGSYTGFPVRGAFVDNIVGLYISKVSLGTPPRDFHVQIDTGNENLWVSCSNCKYCPKTTSVKSIPHLEFFDPKKSSTSTFVGCDDKKCRLDASSNCSSDRRLCSFDISYMDSSETKGLYVYDLLHYDSGVVTSGSTAPIVFGCSEQLVGPMAEYPDRIVDGIFGFGRHGISVVSQLASQGLSPKMFSHCLSGDANTGGVLVLGEVQVPNMVYSPFNTTLPCYNLDLQNISVNGQTLAIDPSVFTFPAWGMSGAIIDSGTSYAYLPPAAYQVFVNTINAAISPSVTIGTDQCYHFNLSITKAFPKVAFNFGGGAALELSPQDYLFPLNSTDDEEIWCMGFLEQAGITLLGDLVLKNKMFVYDLVHERIGWANYNCSKLTNISSSWSLRLEFAVWSVVLMSTLFIIQIM